MARPQCSNIWSLEAAHMKPRNAFYTPGYLKVYAGAMFTEKTSHFLLELLKMQRAGLTVQVFKPTIDTRGDPHTVASRNGLRIHALPIDVTTPASAIASILPETQVIGFDETQFLSAGIIDVIRTLREEGKHIVCTLLDLDFRGEPFGPAATILAQADEVVKLYGVCMVPECKERGCRTQRLVNGKPAAYDSSQVAVEDGRNVNTKYELRCLFHHEVPGKHQRVTS
jgi:thymidine kinase